MQWLVIAGLMSACGLAMGRLLWLVEGRPALERPRWWPRRGAAAGTTVE